MPQKQLSSCFVLTIISAILKNTFDLHSKTDINNKKFWKMGTIVEVCLHFLNSLKYSSKVESPINRSAKAVISRNLTTSRDNHLFIFFIFLFFIFIFHFYFFFYFLYIYIENRHYRPICIALATDVNVWPE